ncbi:MAG: hypothetical protein IT510_06065 [Sulfuritalea sp.]|nr:hypothetical protein [Sulfuritalea sp.]
MVKRFSVLSGGLVDVPDSNPAAPAIADQLADLRVQLATEQARREAAEARCVDLEARLVEADQRGERIASDLERAHGRMESMTAVPALAPLQFPEPQPPVAYEAVVTKRDVDGKVAKFSIVPVSEIGLAHG